MPFQFTPLELAGVILIESKRFGDDRGFFLETYKQPEFVANGITENFVQDNCSHSARGVLRGLHYQIPPFAQGKLITAVQGEIFDVAVDMRQGSPTYGRWLGRALSATNGRMLYIPPGFAHGFCVLSDFATVIYKVTRLYAPEYDRGIIWNDATIGIDWPISKPVLSAKDTRLPGLNAAENPFHWDETL